LLAIQVETPAGTAGAAEQTAPRPTVAAWLKQWEMLGMVLVTVGGGLGLVCFGPLSERLGRRGAFAFYHLGGMAAAGILFLALSSVPAVLLFLPVFGFLTLGLHAGYAVYFPELFPQRLRSTGSGLCFNAGRLLAAPVLALSGWLQRMCGWSLEEAAAGLGSLFLLGLLLLLAAPETQGQELPT
jgi:MFS family permease